MKILNSRHSNQILIISFLICLINPLSAQSQQTAPQLYKAGMDFIEAEDYLEAIITLKQAHNKNTAYFEPLVALAEAYYYIDEYDEALRYSEKAKPLSKDNPRLLNIQGRLLLALGKPDDAANLFKLVQKREPYNIDALLGLAEFSLAKGDEIAALNHYLKSLEYDSRDRRILLSLALMYEQKGDKKASETFLLKALAAYPESPLVQTLAAEYYLRGLQYKQSIYHGMTAIGLQANNQRALRILAKTYLESQQMTEALAILDTLLALAPEESTTWYLRALTLVELQRIPEGLQSLQRCLFFNPADEIARLVFERLVLANYPAGSPERTQAGTYHFEQAAQYLKKNLYSRADFHFKRGVVLAPTDTNGRLARAEYFRTMGQHSLFLRELNVLADDLGVKTNYVKDNKEIFTSLLSQTVSAQWKLDQFNVDRNPLVFRVFYQENLQNVEHSLAPPYLAAYFQSLVSASDKVTFRQPSDEFSSDIAPRTANETSALRMSRAERGDYYAMLTFTESGENFQATADLYLARTGTKIRSYQAFRTGNFKVQNAVAQIVDSMLRELPLRGKLLNRKLNDGLINLGSTHGVKVGDVLHMVSQDAYILRGETPGFEYSAEKKTGTFTVTKVDDAVAQGTIKREGFFDRTNLGDILLKDGETVLKPKDATSNFPFLYNRIRGIR